jgi:hypothetical protein
MMVGDVADGLSRLMVSASCLLRSPLPVVSSGVLAYLPDGLPPACVPPSLTVSPSSPAPVLSSLPPSCFPPSRLPLSALSFASCGSPLFVLLPSLFFFLSISLFASWFPVFGMCWSGLWSLFLSMPGRGLCLFGFVILMVAMLD